VAGLLNPVAPCVQGALDQPLGDGRFQRKGTLPCRRVNGHQPGGLVHFPPVEDVDRGSAGLRPPKKALADLTERQADFVQFAEQPRPGIIPILDSHDHLPTG